VPPSIYKSAHCDILDGYFSSGDLEAKYRAALQLLDNNPGSLATTTSQLGGLPAFDQGVAGQLAGEVGAFTNLWLSGPDGAQADALMRSTYRDAIQRAMAEPGRPKRLESFWISGAARFDMRILEQGNRIVVQVHVPRDPPEGDAYLRRRRAQPFNG
jgi:hypothetical protein